VILVTYSQRIGPVPIESEIKAPRKTTRMKMSGFGSNANFRGSFRKDLGVTMTGCNNQNHETKIRCSKRPRSRTGEYGRRSSHWLLPYYIIVIIVISSAPGKISTNAYSSNSFVRRNVEATKTRLFDSQFSRSEISSSDEVNGFPSMMDELSKVNGTNASTNQNVISNGPGFVPTNGISEKIDGYEYGNNYLLSLEHEESMEEKKEWEDEDEKTAPEINNWTSIMKRGLFFPKTKKPETVDKVYKDLRDMSPYDCEQVDIYWDRLLPVVSYLGTERVVKVYDALRVAYRAHRGQARKSGEPFIIHPVEVSLLLAGLKMDDATVMAGLLHDTVEDTDLTFELLEGMFGKSVRLIVEGETKVSKLPKLAIPDYADEQAENLRQMFVAMTGKWTTLICSQLINNIKCYCHSYVC
jgi:hypothetical protein